MGARVATGAGATGVVSTGVHAPDPVEAPVPAGGAETDGGADGAASAVACVADPAVGASFAGEARRTMRSTPTRARPAAPTPAATMPRGRGDAVRRIAESVATAAAVITPIMGGPAGA